MRAAVLALLTIGAAGCGADASDARSPGTAQRSSETGTWKRTGSEWAFQEEDGPPSHVTMKAGQLVRRNDGQDALLHQAINEVSNRNPKQEFACVH